MKNWKQRLVILLLGLLTGATVYSYLFEIVYYLKGILSPYVQEAVLTWGLFFWSDFCKFTFGITC